MTQRPCFPATTSCGVAKRFCGVGKTRAWRLYPPDEGEQRKLARRFGAKDLNTFGEQYRAARETIHAIYQRYFRVSAARASARLTRARCTARRGPGRKELTASPATDDHDQRDQNADHEDPVAALCDLPRRALARAP